MRIQCSGLLKSGALVLLLQPPATFTIAMTSQADAAVPTTQSLDEVLVRGQRLSELREAVIKAEDRMLARYNELNQEDDLDIECIKLTPTGTRLAYRYCLTRLQKRLQQKDSAAFMDFARDADISNGQATPLNETGVRLMERSREYRENLVKLLQDHPELREMLKERGDAQRSYESARHERVSGRSTRNGGER